MLLSQLLAATLSMAAAQQVHDGVDTSRNAFTGCLRTFVTRSVESHKAAAQIRTELAQQCLDQERAYRTAMIRRDVASHISQAEAESSANQEVQDARANAADSFEDAPSQPH